MSNPFEGAEIISAYSRSQAIDDGFLIDVSERAREAGFKVPVAVTSAVWAECVEWNDANRAFNDEGGRLWDVVWMTVNAIRRAGATDRVHFEVLRVPNHPDTIGATPVRLWALCGPGDDTEPVVTVMLEGED